MQAPAFNVQILLPSLLLTQHILAINEFVVTVPVDVGLYMAPRHDLLAALIRERTFDFDIITHVCQQSRHIEEYIRGGVPAAGTLEIA